MTEPARLERATIEQAMTAYPPVRLIVPATAGETAVDRTVADVVIGGQPMKMKFGVLADENLPWNYELGRSALQDMDIYLDFQNRRSALIPHSDIR